MSFFVSHSLWLMRYAVWTIMTMYRFFSYHGDLMVCDWVSVCRYWMNKPGSWLALWEHCSLHATLGGGNESVKLGHITQYSVLIHILLSAFKVIILHAQVMYQKINGVQIKTKEEIRLSNSIHPACCGSSPMTPSAHPSWAGGVWPVSMVALPDCRGLRFLPQVGWIFGWSQFLADGADHEAF